MKIELDPELREFLEVTQANLDMFAEWRDQVNTELEALTEAALLLRQDLEKTNKASLLEHQGWSRINDLVGLQAEQIRTLGRQLAQLDRTLSAHLEDAGYSE